MEKLESEVIHETQKYDGFYHFYTINKTTDTINFIGSKRECDVTAFKGNLSVNNKLDYFITKNTFKSAKKRSNDDVLGLNNIVIDIDLHNEKKADQRKAIDIIIHSLMNDSHSIQFSKIIDTGRGIQIHTLIQQTSYVLAWLYQYIAKDLCKKYDDVMQSIKEIYSFNFNVEIDVPATTNISGLVRLENTTNTISNTEVKVIYDRSTIFELNDLLDIEIKTEKKLKEFTCETFERNLINSRINYLEQDHKIETGNRMKSLFLYYNNLVQVHDNTTAKKMTIAYNNKINEPLKRNELKSMMNYIDKKGYLKFKQSTFMEWCGGDIIETRASKRKAAKESKELRNKKIIAMMRDNSITYQEIANSVDVSIDTVKRVAKANGIKRNK